MLRRNFTPLIPANFFCYIHAILQGFYYGNTYQSLMFTSKNLSDTENMGG